MGFLATVVLAALVLPLAIALLPLSFRRFAPHSVQAAVARTGQMLGRGVALLLSLVLVALTVVACYLLGIEKVVSFAFVAGLPALALLTALQPLGWFYLAGTSAFVALWFLSFQLVMEDADGPVGFGVGLYFVALGAAFLVAHAVKYLWIALLMMVDAVRAKRKESA